MISAVVLTKNEEKTIMRCLHSLEWCDEIVIIDDYSEDNTLAEINKYTNKKVKIFKRHLSGNFADQRNMGLEKAYGEWVLFIDADEVVSPSLQYEIVSTINTSIDTTSGYFIKRIDTLWGKKLKHGETGNMQLLRLAKKTAGTWKGAVHETWQINGKTDSLKNPLLHYPHQTVTEFLQELNTYTDIRAKELYAKKTKSTSWSIVLYPSAKFVSNYFFRFGFLDGIPGLIIALMMSFHSFLVRSKLWWLWQKKDR